MKTYKGSRDTAPLILNLSSRWPISHPGHFTHRKEPQCPLKRRLGGLQSQSTCGKEKNLLPLLGFETHHPKVTLTVVHYHLCNSYAGYMWGHTLHIFNI
jgi:hypothetical protein